MTTVTNFQVNLFSDLDLAQQQQRLWVSQGKNALLFAGGTVSVSNQTQIPSAQLFQKTDNIWTVVYWT